MQKTTSKLLLNERLIAVLFLGLASGLPLALTGTTLQAWFTQANVSLITIGALSLLGLPYTLKFLWAPVMDQYRVLWFGKRKGWILLTQGALTLALLFLANLDPASQASQMGMVALVIAFFSASQDIAVDANRVDILNPNERGLGAAYFVFAYRVALLFSGGLALIFADYLGWKLTYEIMAGLMCLLMVSTYFLAEAEDTIIPSQHIFKTIADALRDLLSKEKIFFILVLIIFYKLGDALALSLMTNFLLKGLGFSLTEVGLAYKVVSFVATVLGAFVGGLLLTRLNIYFALLWFGLAQAFSNLMFVLLAVVGKHFTLMAASIFIENFCSGLSTAALMAFLMSLCNHRYSASQYALLSAVASLGRVFLGPVAGFMVGNLGWIQFYIWSFMLCFPGIFLLILLREKVASYAEVLAD